MYKTTSQRFVPDPLNRKFYSVLEDSTILSNWTIDNKQKMKYDFSSFPTGVPVSERSLAHAGFYYTGVNNKLYSESSSVTNLESTSKNASSPMRNSFIYSLSSTLEHSSLFSGSFSNLSPNPITSRAVEDFPPLRTNSYSCAMTTEEARFFTYQICSLTFLSPSALVRAGFYYILDKEMATHSSILAWRIPGMGEPGRNDNVKYFCCDGGLRCWEYGDGTWIQVRYLHLHEQLLRLVKRTLQSKIVTTGESCKTVIDIVSGCLIAGDERREEEKEEEKERQTEEIASDDLPFTCALLHDLPLVWRNRMALFQRFMCVLPILDNLLKANNLFVEKNMKYNPTDVSGLVYGQRSFYCITSGHLVVCQECAPSLRKCPIKGTVHNFSHKRKIGCKNLKI
ncbi:hypothetical protein JEQ12_000455 [Ovis aries]|uniref:BIRC2/3-like UBA domain-containing protein n=1 Tax=Ovis aries TaxID=9940 RepID=A0A836D7Q9_SHEEP|nr:hypothetical protein JEQ12_000455 [Ovis aries]